MARRRASPKPPAAARDPRMHMKVGDTAMLGMSYIDPAYWHVGSVLWIADDRGELLVQQYGIADAQPHKALHDIDYVRVFGTLEHCKEQKRTAAAACRDASRLVSDLTDEARELQHRLTAIFETLATNALKSCGGA